MATSSADAGDNEMMPYSYAVGAVTFDPDPPALSGDLWENVTAGTVHDRVSGEGWEAGRIVGGSGRV